MDQELKGMLGLILNKLNELDSKVNSLEAKIELRMDSLGARIDSLEARIDNLEARIDNLDSRQDEIYLVVKAIEHNNQVHRAELDNLRYTVSNVEGTLNTIGDVITKRKAI